MRLWQTGLVAAVLSGCAVGPDYERPPVNVPEAWRVDYATADTVADAEWWKKFKEPVLNDLIETALEQNRDLRIASMRVQEFAFKLQTARADFYPQLKATTSATRDQLSLVTTIPVFRGTERINDNYQAALNLGWELDLWGRIGRASEAALADLLSAEEGRRAVILTLISSVANSYFTILKLDAALVNAQKAVDARRESLRIFEIRFKGGNISQFELAQARSIYEEAAARIPAITRDIVLQEDLLSGLLGRNPGPIKRGRTLDSLVLPPVPQGIPSEILSRRPDILQKEQELIAANARIGVAKAAYFPTIALTGLYGSVSAGLTNFLSSGATIWTIGANVVASIFTGSRIAGQIGTAEAVHEQLLEEYLRTIQNAFQEVNDSLISHKTFQEELAIQQRWISALQDYVRLAHVRYDNGYSAYVEVLDAERSLANADRSLAQTTLDVHTSLVNIYKAMGGGWTE